MIHFMAKLYFEPNNKAQRKILKLKETTTHVVKQYKTVDIPYTALKEIHTVCGVKGNP